MCKLLTTSNRKLSSRADREMIAPGVEVIAIPVYRTVRNDDATVVDDADAIVYMSPSAVTSSVALGHEDGRADVLRVGLGASTCDALRDAGLEHVKPDGSGPSAALAALARQLGPSPERRGSS